MPLTDEAFLEQFENLTLDPVHFDHRGHLRLAWLYLEQYPLEKAVDKVTSGISAYANSLGATDKFQHTLTEAIVRIMATRIEHGNSATLDEYLVANRDLVDDILGVVAHHYTDERLYCAEARGSFVAPDLLPIEAPDSA